MNNPPSSPDAKGTSQQTANAPKPPHLESAANYKEPYSKRIKRYSNRNLGRIVIGIELFCAIALVVITGYYTHYAGGQLVEMRNATQATKNAADAAKTSADIARSSYEMERRRAEDMEEAVCRLSGGGMAAFDNFFPIYISNTGKVTARGIRAHIEISLNTFPNNKKIRVLAAKDISIPELTREKGMDQKEKLPLSPLDWENIADTKQIIADSGQITYENGFERVVSDTVCQVWVYYRTPEDKNNPIQGRGTDCNRISDLFPNIALHQKK
jgi:hypothetical protein